MRKVRTAVLALCAAVFLVAIPSTAGAVVTPAAPDCSSVPFTTKVTLNYQGLWAYTLEVTWCVEKAVIVWAEMVITHEEYSETCTWVGRVEEWTAKDKDTGAWTLSDMSKYSCRPSGGAGTRDICPWATIIVRPDGSSAEKDKGFEVTDQVSAWARTVRA